MKAKGDHHCSKKVEREDVHPNQKSRQWVERRWHVTWAHQSTSPDTRWESNFVLDHSKALQHNGSSNRIVPQVRSSQSSLGSHTYRTARVWRGGQLQGCYIHVHLNRVWHKANTDTAHDNNGAMQVYPGLASSLRALCILPFASSSSRNSMAGKTGMPSTVCLLKYSSLLLTPHRAIQQAVLPHLPLQYQLLRSSTAMRIIKGV